MKYYTIVLKYKTLKKKEYMIFIEWKKQFHKNSNSIFLYIRMMYRFNPISNGYYVFNAIRQCNLKIDTVCSKGYKVSRYSQRRGGGKSSSNRYQCFLQSYTNQENVLFVQQYIIKKKKRHRFQKYTVYVCMIFLIYLNLGEHRQLAEKMSSQ